MKESAYLPFQDFELEHYQSLYEHTVELNLADSSVQCLTTREWLTRDEQSELLETGLYYPQVNGTDALDPTGAIRRNRFPSVVTSPTIAPAGV